MLLKFKQAIQLESVQTLVRHIEKRFEIQLVYLDGANDASLSRQECRNWEPALFTTSEIIKVLAGPDFSPQLCEVKEIVSVINEIESYISNYILKNSRYNDVVFGELIGPSEIMQSLFARTQNVAMTHSTVLIRGENGVGKDLLAQEIHSRSSRKDEVFIAQNCAAIPSALIESEFFGHRKGAFSGATQDRPGLFDRANGGTLFLDEIGDMPLAMQTRLLRAVEMGQFSPVGGDQIKAVDVRLIFATHRDLGAMVRDGLFREDLYYRIKVVELRIPPLRERKGDVEVLVHHFLKRLVDKGYSRKTIAADTLAFLSSRNWPGNVRQLDNELERALIFSGDAEELQIEHFSDDAAKKFVEPRNLTTTMPAQVEILERELILLALKKHGWNKTQAAKTLGISRRNLIRKVGKYHLETKS